MIDCFLHVCVHWEANNYRQQLSSPPPPQDSLQGDLDVEYQRKLLATFGNGKGPKVSRGVRGEDMRGGGEKEGGGRRKGGGWKVEGERRGG